MGTVEDEDELIGEKECQVSPQTIDIEYEESNTIEQEQKKKQRVKVEYIKISSGEEEKVTTNSIKFYSED